jgi:hypothetical protein
VVAQIVTKRPARQRAADWGLRAARSVLAESIASRQRLGNPGYEFDLDRGKLGIGGVDRGSEICGHDEAEAGASLGMPPVAASERIQRFSDARRWDVRGSGYLAGIAPGAHPR